MTSCSRCGRPLKNAASIERGMGDICASKGAADSSRAANGDHDVIEPYDGGDIWAKRVDSIVHTNVQRKLYRHSPTGFAWGYGGSGCADFAFNILLMFTSPSNAEKMHQDFKWKFIATGKIDEDFTLSKSEIKKFIKNYTK